MSNSDTLTLDAVLTAAAGAARAARRRPVDDRITWLTAAADALEGHADELIALAQSETHLPEGRLRGELTRTTFQARLFADRLGSASFLDVAIDHADPDWPMGPRPDIRRIGTSIGPVLVFAASNFPFAFSVAGGDTVSALAAGCPVVVKAHPGHPLLSHRTAAVMNDALAAAGAPAGMFGLIESDSDGVAAIQDRRIRAAAFTGSVHAGRLLFDLASRRPDPIPFYGELGATNPVVVTPDGWAARASDIATGFADSFTLGSGQFCTKPGVVFVPDVDGFLDLIPSRQVGRMLNDRIATNFTDTLATVSARSGLDIARASGAGPDQPAVTILRTTATAALADPSLIQTEIFGPAAIVCGYDDIAEVLAIIDTLEGTLTATVHGGAQVDEIGAEVLDRLSEHAGRVIWNQWPTGVTVSDAQQHGGPWPATTAPTTTSVGTAAIRRFLRPVAYQNVPVSALPPALRD